MNKRTTAAKKRVPSTTSPTTPPAKPYEPTARERAALNAYAERQRVAGPAPGLKVVPGKSGRVFDIDHTDTTVGARLMYKSLGLASADACSSLLSQIVNAATKGAEIDVKSTNAMLALVQNVEPRDTLEAMLAVQMAAVHNATMTFARRLNHVETITQQDSASIAFNKLARTFAAQVEALNRYRGKGQQAIRVEHVTVNGGQAIVGSNVHPQGGGVLSKPEVQAHAEQIAHASVATLPSQDPQRQAVPVAHSEGAEALPDARRG